MISCTSTRPAGSSSRASWHPARSPDAAAAYHPAHRPRAGDGPRGAARGVRARRTAPPPACPSPSARGCGSPRSAPASGSPAPSRSTSTRWPEVTTTRRPARSGGTLTTGVGPGGAPATAASAASQASWVVASPMTTSWTSSPALTMWSRTVSPGTRSTVEGSYVYSRAMMLTSRGSARRSGDDGRRAGAGAQPREGGPAPPRGPRRRRGARRGRGSIAESTGRAAHRGRRVAPRAPSRRSRPRLDTGREVPAECRHPDPGPR